MVGRGGLEMSEVKKLHRVPEEGVIAGVAAGFARYFDADVTLVRVLIVVLAILSGGFPGVVVYIVLAIIMPTPAGIAAGGSIEKNIDATAERAGVVIDEVVAEIEREASGANRSRMLLGVVLILFGFWVLAGQLFPGVNLPTWGVIWPLILVYIGLSMLTRSK
jgi:phage shock protein C